MLEYKDILFTLPDVLLYIGYVLEYKGILSTLPDVLLYIGYVLKYKGILSTLPYVLSVYRVCAAIQRHSVYITGCSLCI